MSGALTQLAADFASLRSLAADAQDQTAERSESNPSPHPYCFRHVNAQLALAVVYATGLYFIALGVGSFAAPALVRRFLLAFAGTPVAHYLELSLRLVVGFAFLVHSPLMSFHGLFTAFGWVLVGTTAVMFAVPWQWHQRFAERSVPRALRRLPLLGVASLVLGSFIIVAAARGAV